MTRAYVLIEVSPKKARSACAGIAKIAGVKSAQLVTGPYDIIALVEGEDPTAIGRLVMGKVHRVEGIGRTITCVVV